MPDNRFNEAKIWLSIFIFNAVLVAGICNDIWKGSTSDAFLSLSYPNECSVPFALLALFPYIALVRGPNRIEGVAIFILVSGAGVIYSHYTRNKGSYRQ